MPSNNESTQTTGSDDLPPPRPSDALFQHTTTAAIPEFASAPNSANFDYNNVVTATSPLPPPPPPPRNMPPPPPTTVIPPLPGGNTTAAFSTLPPLPPPPKLSATNNKNPPSELLSVTGGSSQDTNSPNSNAAPAPLPLTTFSEDTPSILAKRQTHIPVLVIATEAANRMAWKNNLQLVDMFQGLLQDGRSQQQQTIPPFRSMTRSFTPSSVQFQFIDRLSPLTTTQAHEMLQHHAVLQSTDGNLNQELTLLEDRVDELLQEHQSEPGDLDKVTKDAFNLTSPMDIPWLIRYRHALDHSTNFMDFDLLNGPPVIVTVCTTNEPFNSPAQAIEELQLPQYLPESLQNGLYDPSLVRYQTLVLHDNVDGPAGLDENALRQELNRQFGNTAQVIRINSVPAYAAKELAGEETADIWGGGGQLGNCLSVNDRTLLRRFFTALLINTVLPAMERRIAVLNAVVSERKKGVRNVLKSLWRKPKSEEEDGILDPRINATSSNVKYRYDQIENQTRLLADTLFLMQDYEAALSVYRLIRDDFKSDKSMSHYANVHEMMALCSYHLEPYGRAREIFSHFETALFSYTRAAEEERSLTQSEATSRPITAPHSTRMATRLCLLIALADEVTDGRELEVADLLASASSHETALGAAVLLEQSSAFYYKAAMYRKYAFHMLMSGHMFRSAQQEHHAFRCFTSALYIYRHGRWKELHNHLRSALAAQLYTMERMAVSLLLYAKLVGTTSGGKVSNKSQQKFIHHLLEIATDHPKKALAGADRMAAPPSLHGAQREAARNAQLERIVQVVRFTKNATRVLELPFMNLPFVHDKSVSVWTYADAHGTFSGQQSSESIGKSISLSFGVEHKGNDKLWDDLTMMARAELNSIDSSKPKLDETVSAALKKVADSQIRRVIAQLDKEKANRNMIERSKRKGTLKPTPATRARMEPIFCDFEIENPLSVDIEVSKIQLVAKMSDDAKRVCTNQDAIKILSTIDHIKPQQWTFPSTEHLTFFVADFERISKEPVEDEIKKSTWIPAEEEVPFFVVTKFDINLKAGEKTSLSAGIVPLVQGELEIVGLRCKLYDRVWVYHPFDIKGPILQDTRSNRANRVRGPSMLLKAKVGTDMPCLTAQLVKGPGKGGFLGGDSSILLEGQISSWSIIMRNVGNAPASKIFLKTNLPWVNILSVDADDKTVPAEDRETFATSKCVGPSGTLMELPIRGGHLKEPEVLFPGESVSIDIQIRTSGTGKQDFYMLYKYELFDTASQAGQARWLKRMYEVQVYPSISLNASIISSSWKSKEHLMAVELTNNRSDNPTDLMIELEKIFLASRYYRLEALSGQLLNERGKTAQLGWQERITVHYRLMPFEQESNVCLLSESAFSESNQVISKCCVDSVCSNFLCLERASETFMTAWKAHQLELARLEYSDDGEAQPRSISAIRRANTSDINKDDNPFTYDNITSDFHPTSIAKLCHSQSSASKVHIICSWTANASSTDGEFVRGEHHLRSLSVRPESSVRGCPIVATASYEASHLHDFSQGPAVVTFAVTFTNKMIKTSIDFEVSIDNTQTLEFIGGDCIPMSLKGGEDITIPMQVTIHTPGVHDLQALKLYISLEGALQIYKLPPQWLVKVEEA